MKILGTTSALINPPPPRRPTTASAILDTIAEALNRDGAIVLPVDIDSSGLLLTTCCGFRYRLELNSDDQCELVDAAEWEVLTDAYHAYTKGRDFEPVDRDWMGDSGEEIPF
jgi:hypothetical protein